MILMEYQQFYKMVIEEQRYLLELEIFADDHRLVKALAALYELQGYLAARIRELGMELPPGFSFCKNYQLLK